jgi:hypothetical protein
MQEEAAAADKLAQDLKEELESLQRRTAEEATRTQEAHGVELARLALERSTMEVGACCEAHNWSRQFKPKFLFFSSQQCNALVKLNCRGC